MCRILCRLRTKLCPNSGCSRARLCPISFAPCPFPNLAGTLEPLVILSAVPARNAAYPTHHPDVGAGLQLSVRQLAAPLGPRAPPSTPARPTHHPDVGAGLQLSVHQVAAPLTVHLQAGRRRQLHIRLQPNSHHYVVNTQLQTEPARLYYNITKQQSHAIVKIFVIIFFFYIIFPVVFLSVYIHV